jgi:hypothetical protein
MSLEAIGFPISLFAESFMLKSSGAIQRSVPRAVGIVVWIPPADDTTLVSPKSVNTARKSSSIKTLAYCQCGLKVIPKNFGCTD